MYIIKPASLAKPLKGANRNCARYVDGADPDLINDRIEDLVKLD